MRHLTAAQKGEGGGWHYVNLGKTGGHPIGYCANHAPHATEAEARECYSAWQRAHVRLDDETTNWMACAVCGEPTKQGARIEGDGYMHVSLCEKHLTAEAAIEQLSLDRPAGDVWQS